MATSLSNLWRTACGLVLACSLAVPAGASSLSGEAGFAASLQPFVARNCRLCHNPQLKNASLDFDAYPNAAAVIAAPEVWEKVVEKLRTGQMPPQPLPRPDAAELEAAAAWIEAELARAEAALPPDPGRVTARRLNRTEYDNTVRDLLGVELQAADAFPQDDAGYGFDNIGDVLSLSPVLMEKYLKAAERVAQAALFGPEPLPRTLVKLNPLGPKVESSPEVPAEYDVTGLSLPSGLHVVHRFPVEAEYQFRVVLSGSRPAASEGVRVRVLLDGRPLQLLEYESLDGPAARYQQDWTGQTREFRARVTAGDHDLQAGLLGYFEGLPPSYAGPNPSTRPLPPPREFKPPPDATPEKIAEARKRFEAFLARKAPANELRVRHIELIGPFDAVQGPSPASLRKVYTCGHLDGRHKQGCARQIVTQLARRAYRRPVAARDVDPLLVLMADARERGQGFEQGLALALRAMLVGPDFLFRIEGDGPAAQADGGRRLSSHELATRLSYFLWASMPDDELSSRADDGSLSQEPVLAAQVQRMLKDSRARALVDAFGAQWLQFRALESTAPDRDKFPDFENGLRLSMRRETELFLDHVIREDRSILELLDGSYSFLNERLARHYGIAGVKGPEFRRVDLAGTPRGGVLTQASVLTVSSYTTRTSPVLRGKWVLENLLAAPPPPPPAGVPRFDEATVGVAVSLRKQLEAHRSNSVCASCHSRMDPLGFGLENFDGIGAWRTLDGKFEVDATGALPDGRTFNGPLELKAVLRQDREAFTRCLTEKLLTYALGRGLERYDRRTVKSIAARVAESDYRFSALVLEIARSLPFQARRGATS